MRILTAGFVMLTRVEWKDLSEQASGGRDPTPLSHGSGAEGLECAAGNQVALDIEVVGDGGVRGEEPLC